MSKPNPDYRPNPERAVFVHGDIDQQLVRRLNVDILKLQSTSRQPISVYIDSPGGDIAYLHSLTRLLKSSDQDHSPPCRIITIATYSAESAAALLLCQGDYAMAYPESTIWFHGSRIAHQELTVAEASKYKDALWKNNERSAILLAHHSMPKLVFRYAAVRGKFQEYRERSNNPKATDLECFVGLTRENLSENALRVLDRAVKRNERNDSLLKFIFRNENSATISKVGLFKGILEFAAGAKSDWGHEHLLSQVSADFVTVNQYLDNIELEHLNSLCVRWGWYILNETQVAKLKFVLDENERNEELHATVLPAVMFLWLFFVAICYELQEDENDLTATDACWLGLIDEVIGGPPDLYTARQLIENNSEL